MKKVFSLLMVGIMLLSMSACGGDSKSDKGKGNSNNFFLPNDTMRVYKEIPAKENSEDQDDVDYKYGLADKNGETLIDCKYDSFYHLVGDYYMFEENGAMGIVDKEGKIARKADKNVIYIGKLLGKLYGEIRIDKKDGFIILDSSLDEIVKEKGELLSIDPDLHSYVVKRNNKVGVLDKDGKEILPFEYKDVQLAKTYYYAKKDDTYTVLDKNLKEVKKTKYNDIFWVQNIDYSLDNLEIYVEGCSKTACAILNEDGSEMLPMEYMVPEEEDDGRMSYTPRYQKATGNFIVYKDGKEMAVSKDGKKQTKAVDAGENKPGSIEIYKNQVFVYDGVQTTVYDKDLKEQYTVEGSVVGYGEGFEEGLATAKKYSYSIAEDGRLSFSVVSSKIIDEKGNVLFEDSSNETSEISYRSVGGFIIENKLEYTLDDVISKEIVYDKNKKQILEIKKENSMTGGYETINALLTKAGSYLAVTKNEENKLGKTTLYDNKGKEVAKLDGKVSMPLSYYYSLDKDKEKTEYILYDKSYDMEVITEDDYSYVTVDENGKESEYTHGLLDTKGNIVIKPEFKDIGVNYDDVIIVRGKDFSIAYDKKTLKEVCRSKKGTYF